MFVSMSLILNNSFFNFKSLYKTFIFFVFCFLGFSQSVFASEIDFGSFSSNYTNEALVKYAECMSVYPVSANNIIVKYDKYKGSNDWSLCVLYDNSDYLLFYDDMKFNYPVLSTKSSYITYSYNSKTGKISYNAPSGVYSLIVSHPDYWSNNVNIDTSFFLLQGNFEYNGSKFTDIVPPYDITLGDTLDKEDILNFNFGECEAYFYTPSNGSTVNLHYKDNYFWKFNARLYVKFDGDMFITDKKVMEMLISQMVLSSPFELYNPVGTYVERPSITNGFKAKAYIDFKIGFPSDFEFGQYVLTASFPGSGTTQSPDIKSANVKINLTNDGSREEAIFDSDGNVESIGNSSSSDDGLSNFPNNPGSDGSVVDWFKYIGDIVIWLVTYPFKLLSDVFNLLGTYINSMMLELEETARAINGLLTFIPGDILNVAYGFIAFTLLYSIVRGVLKLIRG